jgi:hypothetical protein
MGNIRLSSTESGTKHDFVERSTDIVGRGLGLGHFEKSAGLGGIQGDIRLYVARPVIPASCQLLITIANSG